MHPILLTIDKFKLINWTVGPLYIYSYGVMLALAFILGTLLLIYLTKDYGLTTENVLDLVIYIILGSIIGSRVMYILLDLKEYAANPAQALQIYRGGLSFHGGAIGGFLGLWLYCRLRKHNLWELFDLGVPTLILGSVIGRWGCFLNGCCYGRETHSFVGMVFPVLEDNVPHHPAMLYDSAMHLVLFVLIFQLRKLKHKNGDVVLFYLMGFAVIRFVAEIFRSGVTGRVVLFGWLTQAQLVSLVIIPVALALYLRKPSAAPTVAAGPKGKTAPAADTKNSSKKSNKNTKSGGKKSGGRR